MRDYYNATNVPLVEILRRWVVDGHKAQDSREDSGAYWFGIRDVWPFREYGWTRGGARRDSAEWDRLLASMRDKGWRIDDPAHIQFGRNGIAKLGEGNHRIAIARALGIDLIPVYLHFNQNVTFNEPPPGCRPVPWTVVK